MANRPHCNLEHIEKQMAVVAQASFAIDQVWLLLQAPRPVREITNAISDLMLEIEPAVDIARRALQDQRGQVK